MTIDVIDLRDFYSRRLGIVARRLINRGIRERWPKAEGQRVLGIGYPTPSNQCRPQGVPYILWDFTMQFLPAREVKKIRRRLREIMDAAARVRDRDIALELCTEANLPETAPLRQTVADQRDQSQHELRNRLKRFEARDYSSRWRVRLRL